MRYIKMTGRIGIFTAEVLSLGFLAFHALLYVGSMIHPAFAVLLFLFAVLSGFFLERSSLRLLPAFIGFLVLIIAIRCLVFFFFRIYGSGASSPEADFLFFRFDSTFLPMTVPVITVWFFTFLTRRYRFFAAAGSELNSVLFAAVFWSQGRFNITLYPHPALLAIAAMVFLGLQVYILSETGILPGNRGAGRHRRGYLAWILLPVLLLFLLFMYNWYSREAVTHGGGLIKPTFFRFDFSRYIRLESEISLDDDLVMLVGKEGGSDPALLRRFVLSGYREGEGFFFDVEPGGRMWRTEVPDAALTLEDPGYAGREPVRQEYYIVNFDPSSLITLNYPVRIVPMVNWDESSFLRIYRVESMAAGFFPLELSECPEPGDVMNRSLYDYYTRCGDDEAVRELTLRVTEGCETYFDRVSAIESYLLDNYFYSLKPGVAADGNQLHHFLFESGKGYCSYFAFAMALMARSVGIPARVAVGFFTDPGSEIFHYYPIRADMAHAWVEVYFPDYGWIEFDPTSTVLAPGEEYRYEGMDMQEISPLIEEILKNRYLLREEEAVEAEGRATPAWIRRTVAGFKRLLALWYLTLPVLYILICTVFRLVYITKIVAAKNPRERAVRIYRRAMFLCGSLGIRRKSGETPAEYSGRVDRRYGTCLSGLTDSYLKALFSQVFDDDDLAGMRGGDVQFRVSLRKAFSLARRILSFVNPFHLGRRRV